MALFVLFCLLLLFVIFNVDMVVGLLSAKAVVVSVGVFRDARFGRGRGTFPFQFPMLSDNT